MDSRQTIIVTRSANETRAAAGDLLARLGDDCILALHGELGSGKTCFVQGLAEALDVSVPVTSPTYTIVNEYMGRRKLVHLDLYRLRGAEDALAIGIDDYLESAGVTAVEWPERATELLPDDVVHVHLETTPTEDERRIVIDM